MIKCSLGGSDNLQCKWILRPNISEPLRFGKDYLEFRTIANR